MKYQQHGDVLLIRIDALPEKSVPKKGAVVMEGEHTGHAHRLAEDGLLFEHEGTLFVRCGRDTAITHEEHKPQVLEPGVYRVGRVREWDHLLEESREVKD